MTKKRKKFDCVEMMHQGAEKLQAEIAGMTLEEEVAYWRKRTQELRERQRAAREKQGIPTGG